MLPFSSHSSSVMDSWLPLRLLSRSVNEFLRKYDSRWSLCWERRSLDKEEEGLFFLGAGEELERFLRSCEEFVAFRASRGDASRENEPERCRVVMLSGGLRRVWVRES